MITTQLTLMVILVQWHYLIQRRILSLAILALCLAFFSATQDIATDAYVRAFDCARTSMGTAMAVSGYRIAMLVSGGLTLIVASHMGFAFTYFLMQLNGIGVFAR